MGDKMKKYILLVSRMGAYLIDYIPFYILLYFIANNGVMGYLICLIALFFYRYITTALWGSTIGMRALKLKLDRFGFKICLKREIIRFASVFFYVGYIYAIFDHRGRTFHDISARVVVKYEESKKSQKSSGEDIRTSFLIRAIIYVILVISILKWGTNFVLNDIGGIGLKKICSSEKYFQSFEGDSLLSLNQKELYMRTLGRKYTSIIDIGNKPYIIKISNKIKHTEVYRLNIKGSRMIGEYMYKIGMPIQYICSGTFRNKIELCGISPQKEIILVDENGEIFGQSKVNLENLLSLKCGDIDEDGKDETVILGSNGDVEIYKYEDGKLQVIYNGKIGEDITPEAFYIDKGIVVLAEGDGKAILYYYKFDNGSFKFKSKRYFVKKEISSMIKIDNNLLVSNINRNNMLLKFSNIQTLELYKVSSKIKRLYNLGDRKGATYAYTVKNLEGICDIDNDGTEEIILKSVDKEDVMGQGYRVEIYRFNAFGLFVNRILSWIEGIL